MNGRTIRRGTVGLMLTAVLLAATVVSAAACTNITLQAADGTVVRGRTMEFGIPLQSELLYIPHGTAFVGYGPDAKQDGMHWTARFAAGGVTGYKVGGLLDGVNEQGLSGGVLYFPTFAGFQTASAAQLPQTLDAEQLLTWALTRFATVAEIKTALSTIRVVSPAFPSLPPQPLHYIFTDPTRASLVVEYVGGQLHTYDDPLGVLTNAPDFPWHMTNLRNYINLSVTDVPSATLAGVTFAPLGQGENLHGLPGDFTPPSRFVRAVAFAWAAPQPKTGAEAVPLAFHIMDQFDIPPGAVPEPKGSAAPYEVTQWTAVVDLTHRRFYIWTSDNRAIRLLDLTKFNPNTPGQRVFPLNQPSTTVTVGP